MLDIYQVIASPRVPPSEYSSFCHANVFHESTSTLQENVITDTANKPMNSDSVGLHCHQHMDSIQKTSLCPETEN